MRKRTLSLALAVSMAAMSLAGCGGGGTTATTAAAGGETTAAASEAATEAASTDDTNLSDVEKIIKEAEGMSMEELAKKECAAVIYRISAVYRSVLQNGI